MQTAAIPMRDTDMNAFIPVLGMLVAAAITPGPNNMIVMAAGARSLADAMAAMLGVVAGSLVVLGLVWWGVGAVVDAFPQLKLALSIGGGVYLAWLGVSLWQQPQESASDPPRRMLPSSALGVAVFQLLNPKAWMLVMTAAAAMPRSNGIVTLAILIALVTGMCLALWAFAGATASRVLEQPSARQAFNRIMGALLAISAAGSVVHALTE
jgi:threonine/homoserine/homoserine lactone efflux protein